MTTQQMYEILRNLNAVESAFVEKKDLAKGTKDFLIYQEYLNEEYIQSNGLAELYWVQIKNPINIKIPRSIAEYAILDETLSLFNDISFNITKQINILTDYERANNYFDCMYILEGEMEVLCGKKEVHLKKGDFLFLPPYVMHKLVTYEDTIAIHINSRHQRTVKQYGEVFKKQPLIMEFFNKTVVNKTQKDYMIIGSGENEEIRDIVLHLLIESLHRSGDDETAIECYWKLLFVKLLHNEYTIDTTVSFSKYDSYYDIIVEYLKNNYRTASLESASKDIGLSKQYICKIIRDHSQKTFSEIHNEIKIERVKYYIENAAVPLEIIAEYTGFSDSSYLCRVFKNVVGMTPTQYRKQLED